MALRPDLAQRVQEFIEVYGEEALDRALTGGPMFAGMLARGEIYWRNAMQLYEANAPSTLIIQLDPAAKRQEPKVDVQGAFGSVELSFPVSVSRSA